MGVPADHATDTRSSTASDAALLAREGFSPSCQRVPIRVIDDPTPRDLDRARKRWRPYVFRKLYGEELAKAWSFPNMAERLGSREASVHYYPHVFTSRIAWDAPPEEVHIPLADAIAQLHEKNMRIRLEREWLEEIESPFSMRGARRVDCKRTPFLSSGHLSWGVHCDRGHEQFLHQVVGRKAIVLFPGDFKNTRGLYPRRHQSAHVDNDQVDSARFPHFPANTAHTHVLEPGDTIYLPYNWWHDTRPIGPGFSINFRAPLSSYWEYRGRLLGGLVRKLLGKKLPKFKIARVA